MAANKTFLLYDARAEYDVDKALVLTTAGSMADVIEQSNMFPGESVWFEAVDGEDGGIRIGTCAELRKKAK